MTYFNSRAALEASLRTVPAISGTAATRAKIRQDSLTKPPGSLGRLEEIAIFMAGWQEIERPQVKHGQAIIFAGNHGVARHGVSAYPAETTALMVENFHRGGAAINALTAAAGLSLKIVPLRLETPTADFTAAPAMDSDACLEALNAGAAAIDAQTDLLILGEMGIGNSTSAAAISAHLFGGEIARWVGRGTGIDDAGLERKRDMVARALARHHDAPRTAFETLARLGGRETAAIAGAILAARQRRIPVILDGFICCSAVAALAADAPEITAHCLAGHCSAEPGHRLMLAKLGLAPLLDLGMRLGEGSGAAVAAQLVMAALAAHNRMASFAEAGIPV